MGIAAGAYEKTVREKGGVVDFNNVDEDAVIEAELIVRRSQASGEILDLPSAMSRGGLTGNVSIDKAFTQFQTFILGRASIGTQLLAKNGLKPTKEMRRMVGYMVLVFMSEGMVRYGASELIKMLTGDGFDDDLDEMAEKIIGRSIGEATSSIPIAGQIIKSVNYSAKPKDVYEEFGRLSTGDSRSEILGGDFAITLAKNLFDAGVGLTPVTSLGRKGVTEIYEGVGKHLSGFESGANEKILKGGIKLGGLVGGLPGAAQIEQVRKQLNKKKK